MFQSRDSSKHSKPSQRPIHGPLAYAILLFLAVPSTAHAYLDPASGSIMLQVILGGIAGAGLLVKMYWHKLLTLIGVHKAENDSSDV